MRASGASLRASAASNQHLDLDQYSRNIKVACAEDPALLDAWLHRKLDVDIAERSSGAVLCKAEFEGRSQEGLIGSYCGRRLCMD